MTTVVITRSGRIRSPQQSNQQGILSSLAKQAQSACLELFDRVDTDHTRNMVSKFLAVFQAPPVKQLLEAPSPEAIKHRRETLQGIVRDYGWREPLQLKLQNKWEWFLYFANIRKEAPAAMPFRFKRERVLTGTFASVAPMLALILTVAPPSQSAGMTNPNSMEYVAPPQPVNWLDGEAKLRGSRESVLGAFTYAQTAGYAFASDSDDRAQMVTTGDLVRLDGRYIRLIDVSEPYVMPVVNQFVNRLGEQYAARGCGKLEVTSALRTQEHQETLSNGSDYSVHPTGMTVDLRRVAEGTPEETFCANWLKETLLDIEAAGRIDVTAENRPPHYHVVVLPREYETWLQQRPQQLDPEVKWLAMALYFEGSFNESSVGYEAIASVIKNRVRSSEFPNTILEVVAEGAAGRGAGGCQFSFMCDGRAEDIQLLCGERPEATRARWEAICQNRWDVVVQLAEQLVRTQTDPTKGAVLYYASSMDEAPYWASSDMKTGTVRRIGSHIFACSVHRGNDACRSGDRS
jgi:Cell Wall Hydrolase/Family of unknown function (DUF5715)